MLSIKSKYGKSYLLLYYLDTKIELINDAGMLVEENREENFKPISDKIWKTKIKLINSGNKFIVMDVYTPTLECSE